MSDEYTADDSSEEPRDPAQFYLNTDIFGGIAIGIFGLIGLLAAGDGAFNVWVFPRFNSILILAMAVGMIVEGLVRKREVPVINKKNGKELVLPMAIGLALFYVFFTRLGWLVTTTLLFGGATFALRKRHTIGTALSSLAIAGGFAAFFYYVFGNVFYVPWPEGDWIEALFGG